MSSILLILEHFLDSIIVSSYLWYSLCDRYTIRAIQAIRSLEGSRHCVPITAEIHLERNRTEAEAAGGSHIEIVAPEHPTTPLVQPLIPAASTAVVALAEALPLGAARRQRLALAISCNSV